MLYLNYNSGRRISANGRSLSHTLEDLIRRNPRITSIDLIGHSMGGLVLRSALFYGKQNMYQWIHLTENLVYIASWSPRTFRVYPARQTRAFSLCENHPAYCQYPQQWHSGFALWQCPR